MNKKHKIPDKIIIVFLILILIILISGWLYKDSFSAYFFQDDWFTLRISQARNLIDFFGFFIPRRDVIYYRPLGMQVPFFILRSIFGLNPLTFHLFTYFTHGLNIILLYLFIKKLSNNKIIALVSTFLFGTSLIHYIPFIWSSTYAFPLGMTFCLIALLLYLKYFETNRYLFLVGSIIGELLALLTNELALLIPVISAIHMFIWRKFNKKYLLFALIFPILYVTLRLLFIPNLADTYAIEFGKKTIKALFTYILWLFNWPEEIRNQLENILRGNTSYIKSFGNIFLLEVITLGMSVMIIIKFLFQYRPSGENNKLIKFSIILTILGIMLPILFPNHTYPYYLLFSGIGLYTLLAMAIYYFIFRKLSIGRLLVLSTFFSIWLINGYITIRFQNINHWSIQRARISKLVTTDILNRYHDVISSNRIYLYNDPLLKIVLSNNEAFKVLYNNLSVETIYYGKEDILWKDAPNDVNVIKERLKWNYAE